MHSGMVADKNQKLNEVQLYQFNMFRISTSVGPPDINLWAPAVDFLYGLILDDVKSIRAGIA